MKITFTFGSEECDCEELAKEFGIETERDANDKVKTTYDLNDDDVRRIDDLKKLRMEDLCLEFFDEKLAEETVAFRWED